MKIDHIEKDHLLQAAAFIDENAVPGPYLKNQYWVVINNKEYPFKYLLRVADKFANPESKGLDFQSTKAFRNYVEHEAMVRHNYYPGWHNFFTVAELEIFKTVVKKKYQKQNKADILLGRRILPLFHKTKYWANALQIEGFEVREDSLWQISGQFKPYTWARIYRDGQEAKKVFFTVGISAERQQLVYKIDCQWSQTNMAHALLPIQVERFEKFMQGKNKSWISISMDEIDNYDWDRLIIETKTFIEDNISFYDELVDYVWQAKKPILNRLEKDQLRPQDLPVDGLVELPVRKPTFKGVDKDFLAESKKNKTFGDSGEDLVLKFERSQLLAAGLEALANAVKKVQDGKGYDILSFTTNGEEKHIEVKTTTSGHLKPFPISWNEVEYMKQADASYFLYRLYNYDPLTNSADFFILEQEVVEKLILRELNFEAFIKRIE